MSKNSKFKQNKVNELLNIYIYIEYIILLKIKFVFFYTDYE